MSRNGTLRRWIVLAVAPWLALAAPANAQVPGTDSAAAIRPAGDSAARTQHDRPAGIEAADSATSARLTEELRRILAPTVPAQTTHGISLPETAPASAPAASVWTSPAGADTVRHNGGARGPAGKPAPATTPPAPVMPAAVAAAVATAAGSDGKPGTAAPASNSPAATAAAPSASAAAAASTPTLGTPTTAPPTATPASAEPVVLGRPVAGFAPDVTRVEAGAGFIHAQLASQRVQLARKVADVPLRDAFLKAGLPYPPTRIYLRAFKREHELEVWAQRPDSSYALVKTLPICSLGGSGLGPKLHRGDEQVPEGFYHVVDFNPESDYYLSLRLDYPNAADRLRAGADANLGNDIYLHGGCRSAGCLPLTNGGIEQLYWLALQVRAGGQRHIPIDIFPARLDSARWAQLTQAFASRPDLLRFWSDLKEGYDAFERQHRLPDVAIDGSGRYRIALVTPH